MDENPVGADSNWFSSLIGAAGSIYKDVAGNGAQLQERRIQAPAPAAPDNSKTLLIIGGAIVAVLVLIFASRK